MTTEKIEKAAKAYANLNLFTSIVALLESGLLYGNQSYREVDKIIKICKSEQQKYLRIFDEQKGI